MEISLINTIQNIQSESLTNIMRLISSIFHSQTYFIIILILYLNKIIYKEQIIIILYSQFILLFIKNIFRRKRPFVTSNKIKLLETMSLDNYSFPSGHVLNAYLLTFFIKENTNINIDILSYMVGLSRIYLGAHYLSDVIFAFILGKIIILYS